MWPCIYIERAADAPLIGEDGLPIPPVVLGEDGLPIPAVVEVVPEPVPEVNDSIEFDYMQNSNRTNGQYFEVKISMLVDLIQSFWSLFQIEIIYSTAV